MDTGHLVLGLDVGTSRIKALLIDGEGRHRAHSATPTPFVRTPTASGDEHVEMTAADLLNAVGRAIGQLGERRRRVVGVGVAGIAETGVPLDAAGTPLAPLIAWHDPRGGDVVDRLEKRFGEAVPSRIGQRLRPVASVAKLGWLTDRGLDGVRHWLGVPELCLARLTGSRATEFSLAARTGCYDVALRCFWPEMADAVGVPVEIFPPVVAAGQVMGRVSEAGARWSGLAPGTPVTIGGHDHLAGFTGAGAVPEDVANSVGTAEIVLAATSVPAVDAALGARAAVTVAPGGDHWVVLASASRSGIILDAAARALGYPPDHLDRLAEAAEEADAADRGAAEALLAGIERGRPEGPTGAPGPVWMGLLQTLAARTADAVDRLQTVVGPRRRLVVFGGGSTSGPWLRAKAGATSLPVRRSEAGGLAVARGAAVYAGVAAGWWAKMTGAPPAALRPPGRSR